MPVRLPSRRRRTAAPAWSGPPIRGGDATAATTVESYWNEHTVNSTPFHSPRESLRYLDRRSRQYPLFREHIDVPGVHAGETVLDYGCGPGDDLVGFAARSGAERVVGVDVSLTALQLAAARLALHAEADGRVELVHVPDAEVRLPLDDASIDYLHSGGVIHHASDPHAVLTELRRVLRPTARGRIMVYNRDSVWLHLFVAYLLQVRAGQYADLDVETAFARTTDGVDCPIARCYRPGAFVALCADAGLQAEFVGGYFHRFELRWMRRVGRALADERLPAEHREFLRGLTRDERRYPCHAGRHAGIGGCYVVRPA
jgi:SAM-dependent methyltransferase